MAARQLLDTRGDVKLSEFSGNRDRFEQWAFNFESYAHLLGWGTYVDAAIREDRPIPPERLDEAATRINGDIYFLLATKVKGPACSVVKLVERGNGLEAVRCLYREYRTGLAEDHAALLAMVLTPTWWKDRENESFTDVLLAWDEVTANYELASGQQVTDAMRVATVLAHAPQSVKDVLHTASRETRRSYATLRQFIWENVLARAETRGAALGPAPIEVDAIGYGKGKPDKGKGKGKPC